MGNDSPPPPGKMSVCNQFGYYGDLKNHEECVSSSWFLRWSATAENRFRIAKSNRNLSRLVGSGRGTVGKCTKMVQTTIWSKWPDSEPDFSIRETKMDQDGPLWSILGSLWSRFANRTLAIPEFNHVLGITRFKSHDSESPIHCHSGPHHDNIYKLTLFYSFTIPLASKSLHAVPCFWGCGLAGVKGGFQNGRQNRRANGRKCTKPSKFSCPALWSDEPVTTSPKTPKN